MYVNSVLLFFVLLQIINIHLVGRVLQQGELSIVRIPVHVVPFCLVRMLRGRRQKKHTQVQFFKFLRHVVFIQQETLAFSIRTLR
jgi:hypothetical protein